MAASEDSVPEFCAAIPLDSIGDEPRIVELSADGGERVALSGRFGLVSIERFESRLVLSWLKPGKVLSVKGRISADVTQSCVITLDPVPAVIDEEVDIVFSWNPQQTADIVDPNDAELLEGENIDIGEIASEELALALDPYPRRPDIDPASIELGPGARLMSERAAQEDARETAKKNNPFDVLARLKPKS